MLHRQIRALAENNALEAIGDVVCSELLNVGTGELIHLVVAGQQRYRRRSSRW